MAARSVWKVSVTQIAIGGRALKCTDQAWVELPPDAAFTVTGGQPFIIDGTVSATATKEITAILMAPGSLNLPRENGSSAFLLTLPKDTTVHFSGSTVKFYPDGAATQLAAETKVIWPGNRRLGDPLWPEHQVIDERSPRANIWLPAGGGLIIDYGEAQVRFPKESDQWG